MKKLLVITALFFCCSVYTIAQNIELLKDINSNPGGSSYCHDFTVCGNKLFFIGTGTSNFTNLWVTTGTDASTKMIGPATGVASSFYYLSAYLNKIFFSYNDGINGQELWTSDGTAAGTVLFKDIYPGSTGSFPQNFTVCNGKLFFSADDPNGQQRLFVSNGTAAGTVEIKNTHADLFNGLDSFAVLNNDIFFRSDNGTGSGYGLWKSDGTIAGTVLVKPGIVPGTFPGNYAVLNNKIYFSASDDTHGSELWVSNGSEQGTHIVKNLYPDGDGVFGNGAPQNMIVYNNKIYFSATDPADGTELFVTDGTFAGTALVKDILPGINSSLPYQSVIYNGLLYFTCWQLQQLWKTDGTTAGTVLVKSVPWFSKFAGIWNNTMYLANGFDYAVWQSDGTPDGTFAAMAGNTTNPITSYNTDSYFTTYKNDMYFCASCNPITPGGYEPVKLTLTTLPLHLLSFTGQAKAGKDLLNWTTADEINTSYFSIEQSNNGRMFTAIGRVAAKGGANNTYSFSQSSNLNTAGYYRLQMTDKDGAFTYSPVIKLTRGTAGKITALYYKAGNEIIITNNTQTACNWQLVAANGAFIKQGTTTAGVSAVPLPNIAAGIYMLVCTAPGAAEKTTVVVY